MPTKLTLSVVLTPTSRLLNSRVTPNATGEAEADAGERHAETLPENQRDDVAAGGAERHAHADFGRPLRRQSPR